MRVAGWWKARGVCGSIGGSRIVESAWLCRMGYRWLRCVLVYVRVLHFFLKAVIMVMVLLGF
jgi:hypothetical protein